MIEDEQRYRASAYGLLAAIFRAPPEAELLTQIVALAPTEDPNEFDELSQAMADLASAAQRSEPMQLAEEYQNLFVGVGRGEVLPFCSWYLTGFLMEKPLADLRDDLASLGFARNEDVKEPEDHIAAIYEVLSVMILDQVDIDQQQRFYQKHILPWVSRFFEDLASARSAEFYKAVAQFGSAYNNLEQEYLSMRS